MWHRGHTNRLLTIAALGLLLLLSAACTPQAEEAATTDTEEGASISDAASGNIVSATGEVVPAQWASLSFPISGRVVELTVEKGDTVKEGDILAQLDTDDLENAVKQAEAALAVAEANLAQTKAGPREEEIEQAKQNVTAAEARVAEAWYKLEQLREGATEDQIASAQADLIAAIDRQEDLQQAYDAVIGRVADWPSDLEPGDRTPLDAEQPLRYQLEAANLNVQLAEAVLQDLLDGADPDDLRAAEATMWAAAARRDAAQARLDLLLAGPRSEDIAIREAEVEQAEAALKTARAQLDQAILVAPFDGTVSSVDIDIDEWINPGQTITLVADLDSLRVETTDLNEIDVAGIEEGAAVEITFDALPDLKVDGTVTRIAPKASEGSGVNFTVIIEMDEIPEAIRWGMTAFVDIEVN
jgi:multidrug efflux pump subunit AcrA (membrane-fusion protein)